MEEALLYFLSDVQQCCEEHDVPTNSTLISYLNLFKKCYPSYTNQNELINIMENLINEGRLVEKMDWIFFATNRTNALKYKDCNCFVIKEA